RLPKGHPGIIKMVEWVDAQYLARRTTAISNEEILEQARTHLPEYFK
ncbi:MAG: 2-isopropylmalate synthase, partial [candidate division NC10 bacterium]|nr:2-isopropylmalate synthase [candidate division NC10 bacterium]MBI5166455.1 2-isopropylmalate synthase [candidate division NC10 bacterium]